MIEYDSFGDAESCAHEYDGKDVVPETRGELLRVIAEASTSMGDRIAYLEGKLRASEAARKTAEDGLARMVAAGEILADFAEWVRMNAEDGIPAAQLARHAQKARSAARIVGDAR
jgi:hypothetical protein